MVSHWFVLPRPDQGDPVMRSAFERLKETSARLLAVHVLYADCACSRRIFDHLLEREPPAGVEEVVLLVGDHPDFEAGAASKALRIERVEPAQLKSAYHVESAPLLAVVTDARVAYLGGYTERKQGPAIRDLDIFERLLREEEAPELPLFGCGVSRQLQALLDPLGIKYTR
jgi:hypothetical protein